MTSEIRPQSGTEIRFQIDRIRKAMQQAGVWQTESPDWVQRFVAARHPDFWEWLQYIYFPMRLAETKPPSSFLAPQLQQHIQDKPQYMVILELIIELDAMTPSYSPPQLLKR